MAKIHNPQDQKGVDLINQTTFDDEVSLREAADTLLQTNIDNEVTARQAAVEGEKTRAEAAEAVLTQSINTEKERAMNAELNLTVALSDEITRASEAEELLTSNLAAEAARAAAKESELNQAISDEITRASGAEAAIESSLTTLNEKVDTHVETLEAADAEMLTKIAEERDTRILSDSLLNNSIEDTKDRVATLEGKAEYTTLTQQPSSTVRWTALEFKEDHGISNFINKRIKSIAFKVSNSVTTPHFLGVYDTRTAGTKKLVGISQGTIWDGDKAEFVFKEAIIIPGKFELFLLSQVVDGDHTSDLPAPNVYLESYVTDGTQNYRIPAGTWASGAKRSFYVTFNFVVDRLGTLETEVTSHKADTVQHITAEERSNWNAKASAESVSNLETVIGGLATKEEIADFVTEETVDQKIANVEHHKPIFDFSRNVDKVIFDLSASSEPQIVTLTLSEGKVFAGQAVSSSQIISTSLGAINPGVDSTLSVNIGLQETPAESTVVFVIVDTICDSINYDNTQHVAEIIPVEINVPAVSE